MAGPLLVRRHRGDDDGHHAGRGRRRARLGFAGAFDPAALRAELGIPDEFVPIGVMPVGRPLPDVRSPSLKRGWVPFEEFARFERWDDRL